MLILIIDVIQRELTTAVKINDFLELGTNISFATSDNRLARTISETYGVIPAAISFNPTRPVFDPNKDSGFSEDFSTGLANLI